MEKFKTDVLKNGSSVHVLRTNKFKVNHINIWIRRNLDENCAVFSVLAHLLRRSCRKYPDHETMGKALSELWGADFSVKIIKSGDFQCIGFRVKYALDSVSGEDIHKKALGFLREILLNPNIKKFAFDKKEFEEAKKDVKNLILNEYNDKMFYSKRKSVEIACAEELYSIHEIGRPEKIVQVKMQQVMDAYEILLKNLPWDIYYAGSASRDTIYSLCSEMFEIEKGIPATLMDTTVISNPSKIKTVFEDQNLFQGKLSVTYRTGITYASENYPAFLVFNEIFGSGSSSRIFRTIREKHGLCYYIFSAPRFDKGICTVNCGILPDNFEKTMMLLEQELQGIRMGISQKELDEAKYALKNQYLIVQDSVPFLIEEHFARKQMNAEMNFGALSEAVEQITEDDVCKIAEVLKFDTVFFLCNRSMNIVKDIEKEAEHE